MLSTKELMDSEYYWWKAEQEETFMELSHGRKGYNKGK